MEMAEATLAITQAWATMTTIDPEGLRVISTPDMI